MSVQLVCPSCDNRVTLSDDWAGKRVKCRCGTLVEVPPPAPNLGIQATPPLPAAPPPTPHLRAAAFRQQPRHRADSDEFSGSEIPWIIAGIGGVLVLLLVGGVFAWLFLASSADRFEEGGPNFGPIQADPAPDIEPEQKPRAKEPEEFFKDKFPRIEDKRKEFQAPPEPERKEKLLPRKDIP